MRPEVAYLVLISCICLVGLCLSALGLLNGHRQVRQRSTRVAHVVDSYRPSRGDANQASPHLGLKNERVSFASRMLRWLRYNAAHQTLYKVQPAVLVMLALVPSTGLGHVLTNFVGPVGWAALPVTCLQLCRMYYGWCEDRLMATLYRQFPDALAMIVRAVRVGLPIVEAIRVVARENSEPTAGEFAALVAQTSIGVPLDDALRDMAERNRLPEYRFFATALSLQSQTGGGLTETLEGLADTIRKRVAARMRGHALAAEARMSAYVLGALPIVTGTLLSILNPKYMGVLFTDPTGRNMLFIGMVLLGLGAFSMRTLIRKSLK